MKLQTVRLADIRTNPFQPACRTSSKRMKALAASIAEHGVLTPPVLFSDLVIMAGHRRIQALRALGKESVLAVIRDEESAENAQQLNPGGDEGTWKSRDTIVAWAQQDAAGRKKLMLATAKSRVARIRGIVGCLGEDMTARLVLAHEWITPSDFDAIRELRGQFAEHGLPRISDKRLASWVLRHGFWSTWRQGRRAVTPARLKRVQTRIAADVGFPYSEW